MLLIYQIMLDSRTKKYTYDKWETKYSYIDLVTGFTHCTCTSLEGLPANNAVLYTAQTTQ